MLPVMQDLGHRDNRDQCSPQSTGRFHGKCAPELRLFPSMTNPTRNPSPEGCAVLVQICEQLSFLCRALVRAIGRRRATLDPLEPQLSDDHVSQGHLQLDEPLVGQAQANSIHWPLHELDAVE